MDDLHNLQNENLTLGTFLLGNLEFGIELIQQREVLRMLPLTRVPCATDFIEGVLSLRGSIIPVVNLRTRFHMPRKEFNRETRILNIEVTDELVVGFIVDCVGQIRRIPRNMVEPPPAVIDSVHYKYLTGVAKFEESLLLLLDTAKLLSSEDIEMLEGMV